MSRSGARAQWANGGNEGLSQPPPLDPLNPPPRDCYCDLVLKGGVVDGVVYPWAIVELARAYRFKNLSGTSVGAVAAALTAAAEYSRRYGSDVGFNEVLLKMPVELAEEDEAGTRLFSLFQAAPSGQRLFKVLVQAFSGSGQWLKVVDTLLVAYWRPVLYGLGGTALLCLLVAWLSQGVTLAGGLLGGVVGGLVAVALLVIAVVRDVLALPAQGYGLCSGKRVDPSPAGRPALTDWLHEGIQAASGRPLDRPLTFRDLWEAPGGPTDARERLGPPTTAPRSIDLRMVTTNLSHGRPYGLPMSDQTSRLFFRLEELEPYFPATVLAHLKKTAQRYAPVDLSADPAARKDWDFLELPQGELPIVVAARLSLSFPILFRAVPLYAIDYEAPKKGRGLQRCWFSDGGICANFLIHQFDGILPRWPTFGISLQSRKGRFLPVWVTKYHKQGRGDEWSRFDAGPLDTTKPAQKFAGFVGSIVDAARSWNDNTAKRMPGTRDRVARVYLDASGSIGASGLNLRMPGATILELARERGLPAGRQLVRKFNPGGIYVNPYGAASKAWGEHRWVRFNSFVAGLRERIDGFEAASESAAYSVQFSAHIQSAMVRPPLRERSGPKLTQVQADALEDVRKALVALERSVAQANAVQPYLPLPTPEMRMRMRL